MLDLLVQLLSMNSYVKLSIWLQFSKVWFEDYTQWIVLALWTVSENIFPPSQLIYLSEVSVNLLKSCFCYLVPKEIIRVPMLFGLWLQFCFLKLRIRGHLSRAHYRDIAKKAVVWLSTEPVLSFLIFCIHGTSISKITKAKDSMLYQRDY